MGTIMMLRMFPVLILLTVAAILLSDHMKDLPAKWIILLFSLCSMIIVSVISVTINNFEREKNQDTEMDILKRTSELIAANRTLHTEISERVRSEQRAEYDRKLFNDVLELMPAYMILLTSDYRVAYANRFFRERFGESHGRRCYEYLFGRTEPCEVCETFRVLKENRPVTWEWTGPDNHIYSIFDFPFSDSKDTTMIMEMGIDVTSLKQAQSELVRLNTELEERVAERTRKLNIALQNGNIGTWEWDIENNRLEWDERMQSIFGFNPGSFNGNYETFEKCLAEDDVMHVRKAVNDALNNDVPFEEVYRIVKDGSLSYISAKASVIRQSDGTPVKMSGVCFDITDMKKGAERTLFKLNEDLLRSNRELEQFAYVASHDLQEPLRMVSSYTQLLELRYNDRLDKDAREFIKYAVDGTVRMQNLINDLLGFSRIETKGGKFGTVDINNCLMRALNNMKFVINSKKVFVTHSNLPVLTADETQIVLLFQNLIGNAIKFCKTSPRIHVSVKAENNTYVFSVRDNGIGIEPQYFEKIFMIFQRLVRKDEYEGTGIGLAICKRIVERHQGKIWVESELGTGSTFFFTIPRYLAVQESGESFNNLS